MFKERFISSLLLCVFAITFTHSIIPHHHHDEVVFEHHQGSSGDHHHDDTEHNFLGEAFSFFQHDKGGTVIYETDLSTSQYHKININNNDVLLVVQHVVRLLYQPPLIHPEHYSVYFTPSSHPDSSLFRGPPVVVG